MLDEFCPRMNEWLCLHRVSVLAYQPADLDTLLHRAFVLAYQPADLDTLIPWWHLVAVPPERWGVHRPYPSFLQQAGSTGNLNLPLAMAVCEAWCF